MAARPLHALPCGRRRCAWLIALAGCWLLPQPSQAAEEKAAQPLYSTDAADRDACRLRMNRIYGALQEFRKEKDVPPKWLSELVPDFIRDPEVLVCPYVWKTGNLRKWREAFTVFPVFADPAVSTPCTYAYEFCTQPIPELPRVTCRQYKQSQMALVGFGAPIVRCLAHRPVINLAFDGSLYESDITWEDKFVTEPSDEQVLHNIMLTTGQTPANPVHQLIRPRDRRADMRMLDLSSHYTATLLHLSQVDLSGKLLKSYPQGLTNIDGIKFDIRGLVHLSGRSFPIPFPERVDAISVEQTCARIHFLHGAIFPCAPGTRLASYRVQHRDGRTTEVPVVYGQDVWTRWSDGQRAGESEKPKPAWVSPPELAGPQGRSLRLYRLVWRNPRPEVEIQQLDFVSHQAAAAPFLVAVTLE